MLAASHDLRARQAESGPLFLLDSIALIGSFGSSTRDAVVVAGSHGGVSAASFVVDHPYRPRLVCFNDAGRGKDDAGIAGLALLQAIGVAACAYSHESARIGEAADGLAHGRITHLNERAVALGVQAGESVATLVARLRPATSGPAASSVSARPSP